MIVEQHFIEDIVGEVESPEHMPKRRKILPISLDSSPFIRSRGNKAKEGTGYAGDRKEDVDLFVSIFHFDF